MSHQVLPFYVVCDESRSMEDHIDDLNSYLQRLHQAIGTDPVVSDKTRFCVIGFSDSAEVLLPLSELGDVDQMVGLTAKSSTSYGSAFETLYDTIEQDVDMLKGDNYVVYRPAVFFLSDGQPTDKDAEWHSAHDRLTDADWGPHPNVVAFGIGDADPAAIKRVATFKAFMVDKDISPVDALHEFARTLTQSIVDSVGTVSENEQTSLRVRDDIDGYTELPLDSV